MSKSNDLEFISVDNDDDEEFGMNQAYGAEPESSYETAIGNTFLKQSKHPSALFFHVVFKVKIMTGQPWSLGNVLFIV